MLNQSDYMKDYFKKEKENKKHYCKICDYSAGMKSHLDRHFKTKKHMNKIDKIQNMIDSNPNDYNMEQIIINEILEEMNKPKKQNYTNKKEYYKDYFKNQEKKYECECCNFKTVSNSKLQTHFKTKKHIRANTTDPDYKTLYNSIIDNFNIDDNIKLKKILEKNYKKN